MVLMDNEQLSRDALYRYINGEHKEFYKLLKMHSDIPAFLCLAGNKLLATDYRKMCNAIILKRYGQTAN